MPDAGPEASPVDVAGEADDAGTERLDVRSDVAGADAEPSDGDVSAVDGGMRTDAASSADGASNADAMRPLDTARDRADVRLPTLPSAGGCACDAARPESGGAVTPVLIGLIALVLRLTRRERRGRIKQP